MTHYIKAFAFIAIICSGVFELNAQVKIVSGNEMSFTDSTDRNSYRSTEAGDIAILLTTNINSDFYFDEVGSPILEHEETVSEDFLQRIAPAFRYYISARTSVSAGLLLSRTSQLVTGEDEAAAGYEFANLEQRYKSRSVSLRLSYDRWNKPVYFRKFNLDSYYGMGMSIGRSRSIESRNEDYGNGEFSYETRSTPSGVFGLELYTGLMLRFDIFSVGAEFLGLGFDRQFGFGASEVTYSYDFDEVTDSGTYWIGGDGMPNEFLNQQFSSLSARSSKMSMYRGVRLLAVLHIN
ncbi:MAG TPA: hypothetical protein DCX00_07060 [Flavobacteriales bacterium]|nr:hypothetical protein [Flavobacteriales bacterium]